MAIYTPRGLKIRLPLKYAFALLARLYPEVSAFNVLRTTEGIESIPGALTFIAGVICFALKLSWLQIGLIVFFVSFIASFINRKGITLTSLINLGILYNYFAGFGILLIALAGLGYYLSGWKGVVAFFVAKLSSSLLNTALDFRETRRIHNEAGVVLTSSERHFINAYRLKATKVGITSDVSVDEEEMEEENWKPVFLDLSIKYPKVVNRFTND